MDKREIKEELALKKISQTDIAKKFGCTPSNVNQIINDGGKKEGLPSLIRKYIARAIEKEYSEVWT